MRSIGTAYYNCTLYKDRLPLLFEWHCQITGIRRVEPSASFFPHSFLAKRMGARVWGWVSPNRKSLEAANASQKNRGIYIKGKTLL